jgi:hypothetical protein
MLKNIDCIGPKVDIMYNKSTRVKTTLGAILTTIIGLAGIVSFIYFGIDLYYRAKPKSYVSKLYEEDPKIKNEGFGLFAVAAAGPGMVKLKEMNRMFEFVMIYITFDQDNEKEKSKRSYIKMSPCKETELFKKNQYNITNKLLTADDSYYCIPDNFEGGLYGSQSSRKSSMMQFVLM